MKKFPGFSPKLVEFLADLRANNARPWFEENKNSYERWVREPALDFIEAFAVPLGRFAPYFAAIPKKSGGSMMRPYRDIRFSRDKTPFKTNVGIQFRHELGKDVHAPGYYFHIDPDNVFLAVGLWRPESAALANIRDSIVDSPQHWQRLVGNKKFQAHFELGGSALKRPPRGYSKEHPLIEDIKRKDFIAVGNLDHESLYDPKIVSTVETAFRAATPWMKFLCKAVGVSF